MNAAVAVKSLVLSRSALVRNKVAATTTPSFWTKATTTSTRGFATDDAVDDKPLTRTALYDWHVELGGTMVPFAGYELPVHYQGNSSGNGGVLKEHLWCRSDGKASLFDVSHMGQVRSRCSVVVGVLQNRYPKLNITLLRNPFHFVFVVGLVWVSSIFIITI